MDWRRSKLHACLIGPKTKRGEIKVLHVKGRNQTERGIGGGGGGLA